jgi:hypothetical protein
MARLIFMTLSAPPGDGLLMMRPILDLFSAEKFDVSLNTNPFPVKMYSGTVIPAWRAHTRSFLSCVTSA